MKFHFPLFFLFAARIAESKVVIQFGTSGAHDDLKEDSHRSMKSQEFEDFNIDGIAVEGVLFLEEEEDDANVADNLSGHAAFVFPDKSFVLIEDLEDDIEGIKAMFGKSTLEMTSMGFFLDGVEMTAEQIEESFHQAEFAIIDNLYDPSTVPDVVNMFIAMRGYKGLLDGAFGAECLGKCPDWRKKVYPSTRTASLGDEELLETIEHDFSLSIGGELARKNPGKLYSIDGKEGVEVPGERIFPIPDWLKCFWPGGCDCSPCSAEPCGPDALNTFRFKTTCMQCGLGGCVNVVCCVAIPGGCGCSYDF